MSKLDRKPSFFLNKQLNVSVLSNDEFVWNVLHLLVETGDKWRIPLYEEYTKFFEGEMPINNQRNIFNNLRFYFASSDEFTNLSVQIKNIAKYSIEEVREIFESKLRNFRTDMLPFGQIVDYQLNDWINKNI